MSSRKEELLSRLRNTLAIVSQATKFDTVGHEENRSQNVVPKMSISHAADYATDEQNTNPGFLSRKVPVADNSQLYGDRRKMMDFDNQGSGFQESQWNARSSSISQRNLPHASAISSIENVDNVEDEDEFLYGSSSSSKEPARALESDVLLNYLPKGNPESSIKSIIYPSSASYRQQVYGQTTEKDSRYTGINSDAIQNVLRMVSKQNPSSNPVSASTSDFHAGTALHQNWLHPNDHNPVVSKEEYLRPSSTFSQPNASEQSASRFWNNLKTASSSYRGGNELKETENRPVKSAERTIEPVSEESSSLSSTVDKILQTINLDGDLRKLMEEKFKKENEKAIKEEEEKKQRLALEKLRMEEEKAAKEAEKHKKQLLEEKNRLLAEKFMENLLKIRDSKEGLLQQAASVLGLFTEDVEKDLEETPDLGGNTRSTHDISDQHELCPAGESDSKIYPVSVVLTSNQQIKPDIIESRLVVTGGSLLKPEIDSKKVLNKSRSNVDSAWEQSTEEFLRKLQSKEETKTEERKTGNVVEEPSVSRLSRGRSQGDSRSSRTSDIASRGSKGSADEADIETKDQKSSENIAGKMVERSSASSSKSPVPTKIGFPDISQSKQTHAVHSKSLHSNVLSTVKELKHVEGTEMNLVRVLESKTEKTKEEMKADIEALQAELANLQKIHSGLVGKDQTDPVPIQLEKTLADSLKAEETRQKPVSSSSVPASVGNSVLADPVLTVEQMTKLKGNQAEMISNIHELQLELDNLQRLSNGLQQRPASHQRNVMLEENKRMQEEVQDQLWALRRATQELTERLLLQEKNQAHPTQSLPPLTTITDTSLPIGSGSKTVTSSSSECAPSSVVTDTKVSVSTCPPVVDASAVVETKAKISIQAEQGPVASKTKEVSVKSKEGSKSTTEKDKKKSKRSSSSRSSRSSSSSSSSSSNSSSSSSSSSSDGSRSRSRSSGRGRKKSNRTSSSRDTSRRSSYKGRGRSDSRGRSKSRDRSRSRERWNTKSRWSSYNSRNVGYQNRTRPNWRGQYQGRNSERTKHDDRNKSYRHDEDRSPRRERRARSRSTSVGSKKSKPVKSRVPDEKLSKSVDKNSEAKVSSAKNSNELETKLKDVAEKAVDNKTDVAGSVDADVKKINQSEAKNEDKSLDDRKKCALELAISMYNRAEEYYDGGNMWCRKCDLVFPDTSSLCHHLHSDHHQLVLDPNYNNPKRSSGPKLPTQTTGVPSAPSRGDEFLMPLQAFFCSLCCEFAKDDVHAEAHLKSAAHNNKFKQFLKENPSYEFQYLMDKMNALLRSAEATSLGEMKRSASSESTHETEVKRIKITPISQEAKQSLAQNSAERLQFKMLSGSLNRAIPPSSAKPEEKRVVMCDRKVSSSQSLHRNPSPPGPIPSSKTVTKPSVESSGLHFKVANQLTGRDEKSAATSKLQDSGFDIWSSPSKSKSLSAGDLTKSGELSAKSEKKFEPKPGVLAKKSAVNPPASALKFQLNKGKKITMGKGAGRPSFDFKDFEIFDECD